MNTPTIGFEAVEFSTPPPDPISLAQIWFADALASNVCEPGALALATVDAEGHAFNRIMQVLDIRDTGFIFTTHKGSKKGRHLTQTGWASGVLYWREKGRQLILTGHARPLPDEESDTLWATRPMGTRPMSSIAKQSEPLLNENALRAKAAKLNQCDQQLPRPRSFTGYLLEAQFVEFWQADPRDRLHKRLLYTQSNSGWRTVRLQP